jgi:hypothetical protein
MNAPRDDDALSWAGDDPTPASAGTDREPDQSGLPEGWTTPQPTSSIERSTDTTVEPDATVGAGQQSTANSVALVAMGILAGIYLLYSIGWFIGVVRLAQSTLFTSADPVTDFMASLGGWLAVAAPVIWFGVTFWLTMSRPRARWVWLLIGVVVLVPVPFLIGSGVSA